MVSRSPSKHKERRPHRIQMAARSRPSCPHCPWARGTPGTDGQEEEDSAALEKARSAWAGTRHLI